MEMTYRITVKESFRLFRENEAFQKATETGNFQCVSKYNEDGSMSGYCYFVIGHPKFVEHRDDGKTYLTKYAKENLSECALQFEVVNYPPLSV